MGSNLWTKPGEGEPGSTYLDAELEILNTINWDRLLSISSTLRNGVHCTISERYSSGQFNMVRRVDFTDGVSWVARIRMPLADFIPGGRESLSTEETIRIEIASMKLLKTKTSIPVPEVHSYNADPANDFGAPYILMDYIHGTVAQDLRQELKCARDLYGTPDQDRRFRKQMADIQITLSSLTFDRIGSLYCDEETSEFFIGPEMETGKGPWKTSMEYYNDVADHRLQVCANHTQAELHETPSFANPILFKHLMSLYSDSKSNHGPFGLVNRDFGAHNLLVDDEFRIVGVIDFDGMMAAPIEVVAQYPVLTGLDRETPFYTETNPYALERIEVTKPKLIEYKQMLKAAESRIGGGGSTVADTLMSTAADVYGGLMDYDYHAVPVNNRWMEAYTILLYNRVKSD
ncbi:hypothetical protein FPOAC1_000144 [Fusarium poae]|uniref:hypothetical protein n=1 Tax=Fusarium poae TaxID=36050 RepID=UPI001CE8FB88|nr:hypothetical protein FPOAC1_000144 [Fusarium poae]KAG8674181.1 hypothetical protein FPOAC1_000144 [Fusarium poae]